MDRNAAIWLMLSGLHLFAEDVKPCDVLNADETAFLLCPQGVRKWARRGSDAVQIHVAGN